MKKFLALTLAAVLLGGGFALTFDAYEASAQAVLGPGTGKVSPNGMADRDLVRVLRALSNRVVGASTAAGANLSVATTVDEVRTNAAVSYMINGQHYFKAATDNFCNFDAFATSHVLTATTGAVFRFEIDAAGNCTVSAGPVGSVASGTVNGALVIPPRSANKATLGTLLVAGQAFTPGTTTTAASATVVYTNGDPDLNAQSLEP